jgi:hypothetical protein
MPAVVIDAVSSSRTDVNVANSTATSAQPHPLLVSRLTLGSFRHSHRKDLEFILRLSYLLVFCLLALVASANSIRRRIASERDGSSFCLAQLSIADLSAGGSRTVSTGSRPVAGRPGFFGITFSFDRLAMFW